MILDKTLKEVSSVSGMSLFSKESGTSSYLPSVMEKMEFRVSMGSCLMIP